MSLPMRPREGHPIAQVLGLDGMRRLIEAFGAGLVGFPAGPERGQAGRRHRAARLLAQGFSTRDVADMVDVSQRTTERLSSRLTRDGLPPEERRLDAAASPGPLFETASSPA